MDLLLQESVGNHGFAKEIMNVTPSVSTHSAGVFLQSLGKKKYGRHMELQTQLTKNQGFLYHGFIRQ